MPTCSSTATPDERAGIAQDGSNTNEGCERKSDLNTECEEQDVSDENQEFGEQEKFEENQEYEEQEEWNDSQDLEKPEQEFQEEMDGNQEQWGKNEEQQPDLYVIWVVIKLMLVK